MEEILEAIRAATGLIENQGLSFEEQLELIKPVIKKELKEAETLYYKLGLKKGMNLISEHIESEFGQL